MTDLHNIFIAKDATILDAMRIIDEGTLQIALVVDEHKLLFGTITDGDIRRAILRGEGLDTPVSKVMNAKPITAHAGDSKEFILLLMQRMQRRQIPVVDDRGKVLRIELLDRIIHSVKRNNWVVLMAGGLGSRLGALTKDCPKPLLKINGKPILEIILENFIASGFHRFYISVNYKAEMIKEYFQDGSRWGVEIRYIHEKERMGTAGSLSLIDEKPHDALLVINGDLLTKVNFQQLLDYHMDMNVMATMCVRDYEYQVPYGVIKVENQRLVQIKEKPISKQFINGGIYVIQPEALSYIPPNTFFDMPSLFQEIINRKEEATVYPIREYWIDIGRLDDFERANGEYTQMFGVIS